MGFLDERNFQGGQYSEDELNIIVITGCRWLSSGILQKLSALSTADLNVPIQIMNMTRRALETAWACKTHIRNLLPYCRYFKRWVTAPTELPPGIRVHNDLIRVWSSLLHVFEKSFLQGVLPLADTGRVLNISIRSLIAMTLHGSLIRTHAEGAGCEDADCPWTVIDNHSCRLLGSSPECSHWPHFDFNPQPADDTNGLHSEQRAQPEGNTLFRTLVSKIKAPFHRHGGHPADEEHALSRRASQITAGLTSHPQPSPAVDSGNITTGGEETNMREDPSRRQASPVAQGSTIAEWKEPASAPATAPSLSPEGDGAQRALVNSPLVDDVDEASPSLVDNAEGTSSILPAVDGTEEIARTPSLLDDTQEDSFTPSVVNTSGPAVVSLGTPMQISTIAECEEDHASTPATAPSLSPEGVGAQGTSANPPRVDDTNKASPSPIPPLVDSAEGTSPIPPVIDEATAHTPPLLDDTQGGSLTPSAVETSGPAEGC